MEKQEQFKAFLEMDAQMEQLALKNQYAREIRANHRSVTGWINNDKSHEAVPFESTLERDFVYRSLFCEETMHTRAQPFTLTYEDEAGSIRSYTPDYALDYYEAVGETKTVIIEVKYENDWAENEDKLRPAFEAMSDWAEENGQTFYLLTETHIRTPAINNIKAIFPFRFQYQWDDTRSSEIYMAIKDLLPLTNREILDLYGEDCMVRAEIQSNLWELLSIGQITCDIDRALDMDSVFDHRKNTNFDELFFKKGITFK